MEHNHRIVSQCSSLGPIYCSPPFKLQVVSRLSAATQTTVRARSPLDDNVYHWLMILELPSSETAARMLYNQQVLSCLWWPAFSSLINSRSPSLHWAIGGAGVGPPQLNR